MYNSAMFARMTLAAAWFVATEGPSFAPASQAEFASKLVRLEAQKVTAIEEDDLELALHLKKAISVLKRSAR